MPSMPSPPSIQSFFTTGASAANPADAIERLSWASYTRQGKALLDHLKIQSAWIMGGCMGCSVALAFGVHYPDATRGLLLHWPVGGYRWKVNSRERFMRHYNFAKQNGLPGCRRTGARRQEFLDGFGRRSVGDGDRARSCLRRTFRRQDLERYLGNYSDQRPQPIRPRYGARRRAGRGAGR